MNAFAVDPAIVAIIPGPENKYEKKQVSRWLFGSDDVGLMSFYRYRYMIECPVAFSLFVLAPT